MIDNFNGGYTKALLDVKNFFEVYSSQIKYYRLNNYKGVIMILDQLIKHREELRETGGIASLKFNPTTKNFVD